MMRGLHKNRHQRNCGTMSWQRSDPSAGDRISDSTRLTVTRHNRREEAHHRRMTISARTPASTAAQETRERCFRDIGQRGSAIL